MLLIIVFKNIKDIILMLFKNYFCYMNLVFFCVLWFGCPNGLILSDLLCGRIKTDSLRQFLHVRKISQETHRIAEWFSLPLPLKSTKKDILSRMI